MNFTRENSRKENWEGKMMRKALVVGIDNYPTDKLNCCVNDANEVAKLLEFNEDEKRNFSIKLLTDANATKRKIKKALEIIYSDDTDVGLFYFSGHGFKDDCDGKIVTVDFNEDDYGISLVDIINIVKKSKCKNKIVILDCCFSGKMGEVFLMGEESILPKNTTILTACREQEVAIEVNGHGIFTNLLINALEGGACDISGNITPGSIYSFIDSSLGAFDQRPLFKTNVSEFVSLRKSKEKMSDTEIRKLAKLFLKEEMKYQLDSSFEPTNYPGSKEIGEKDLQEPYFKETNGLIFSLLQKGVSNGLVKPTTEKHMFYAAMKSDTCELTGLGKHYRYMVEHEKI